MCLKSTLLTLFTILCTITVTYAATVSYTGRVVDDGGVGVDYAAVVVMRVGAGVGSGAGDSTVVGSAFTDAGGGFAVNIADSVAGGSLVLEVSCFRYEKLVVRSDSGTAGLPTEITLSQSTINQDIEKVVVAGKKTSFTRQGDRYIFRISDELEIVKSSNVFDILKLTPLVQADDDGTISITGAGNTHVYINGRKNRMQSDALVSYLKSMPAALLSNIEVMPIANSTYAGEGVFGVIDIKLKKRPEDGVSGMASIRSSQAHANSQAASVSLDVRKKKVAVSTSLWLNNNNKKTSGTEDFLFQQSNNTIFSDNLNYTKGQSYGASLQLDYDISDRHVVGFFVNADFGRSNNRSFSTSKYGNKAYEAIDSIYQNNILGQGFNRNISANLNYQFNTDKKGSTFTVDVDYLDYLTVNKQHSVFDRLNDQMETEYTLRNLFQRTPQAVSAWSGRVAYNHMFGRWGSLSVGADSYSTVSDDDSYYANGSWENTDYGLSNHFVFTEVISSLFASYSTQWLPKLSTTIGGRMQYTYTMGDQRTTGEVIRNYKMRFLPSAFISYNPSEDHSLSYSIVNNVSHPGYQHMNSFRTYSSPTSYSVGNPFLQSVNSLVQNLNYMYKGKLSISLSHHINNDYIGRYSTPDGENGVVTRPENYGTESQTMLWIGMVGSYFDDYWQASNGISINYVAGEGEISGVPLNYYGVGGILHLNNTITLSKKYRVFVLLKYVAQVGSATRSGYIEPYNYFNFGIRKGFKNWNITLDVNDVFNQYKWNGYSTNNGITNAITNDFDHRSFAISISYNFGSSGVKSVRDRSGSNDEVKNRL